MHMHMSCHAQHMCENCTHDLSTVQRMCLQVPLFKHCDIRTMISIVERMQMAIYCPGEMMVREGTPGKGIFLINHGTAHVVRAGQVVVVLSDHEFFGEQNITIADTVLTPYTLTLTPAPASPSPSPLPNPTQASRAS